MELQILTNSINVKQMYEKVSNSNQIYSFNLYFVKNEIIPPRSILDIDLGIQCVLKKINTSLKLKTIHLYTYEPFWIIPNKFITKTPLISQNSPNLIEPSSITAGTELIEVNERSEVKQVNKIEPLIVSLFNNSDKPYKITTGMSLFKIAICGNGSFINKITLV